MSKQGFSPREAVCQFAGWDFAEAADYRYHYGRTQQPVYSIPDGYICALANGKKPAKTDREGYLWNWKEATGSAAEYCKYRGYTVWVSTGAEED
jgi:hypothetical protein